MADLAYGVDLEGVAAAAEQAGRALQFGALAGLTEMVGAPAAAEPVALVAGPRPAPPASATPPRELAAMHAICDGLEAAGRQGMRVTGSPHGIALRVLASLRDNAVLVEAVSAPSAAPAPAADTAEDDHLGKLRRGLRDLRMRVADLPAVPTPRVVQDVLADLVALAETA